VLILLDEGKCLVKEHMLVSDGVAESKVLFTFGTYKVSMFTTTISDFWLHCVLEVFKIGSALALG
jgi:hypothetical protein